MNSSIEGKIVVQGFKPSKPVISYMKKRVEKLLSEKRRGSLKNLYYFLKVGCFKRRDRYECFLYVRDDKEMQRGFDMGKNIQDAVENALKHLHPIP